MGTDQVGADGGGGRLLVGDRMWAVLEPYSLELHIISLYLRLSLLHVVKLVNADRVAYMWRKLCTTCDRNDECDSCW